MFFYSCIASTAYTAANTIILDLISAGGATVGFYTSADKLITAAKNGLSPISDSLYPYITTNVVLYFSGHLNMVTLGILVSVAETAILLFRIAVILIHRKSLRA